MEIIDIDYAVSLSSEEIKRILHMSHFYLTSVEGLMAYSNLDLYLKNEHAQLKLAHQLSQLISSSVYSSIMEVVTKHYSEES